MSMSDREFPNEDPKMIREKKLFSFGEAYQSRSINYEQQVCFNFVSSSDVAEISVQGGSKPTQL